MKQPDNTKHSPLPWYVLSDPCHYDPTCSDIEDANGNKIAQTVANYPTLELDAHLIVDCVNEAPELHKRIAELEAELAKMDDFKSKYPSLARHVSKDRQEDEQRQHYAKKFGDAPSKYGKLENLTAEEIQEIKRLK